MTTLLPGQPAAARGAADDSRAAAAPPAAVRLEHVVKVYGDVRAIDDVTLEIPAGSMVAVIGANGAGKSTLLALVAGLVRPTSGAITVHGRPVEPGSENGPLIGLLTHRTMLYDRLTARENLELHARLRGIDPARVDIVLEEVDLTSAADEPAGVYSHGMRKRLALARVLAHDPAVLLLDEPFACLDPEAQQRLSRLFQRLRDSKTLMFATHDLDYARSHADRVLRVDAGSVVTVQPVQAVGASHRERNVGEAAARSDCQPPAATPSSARPAGMLRTAWTILRKDLTIEARGRSTSSAVLVLAGLLAFVLGMAFEPLAGSPRAVSGILFVLVVFTALHGLTRSFDEDFDDDALPGLLLTGAVPAGVYLGRVASTTVVLLAVALGAAAVVAVLFAAPALFGVFPQLAVVMALAVVGLASVGAILTLIARHSPLGETLLPLLFLPLAVPVLLAGVESVTILLDTGVLDTGWVRVLLLYAVGMLAASTTVFEHAVER